MSLKRCGAVRTAEELDHADSAIFVVVDAARVRTQRVPDYLERISHACKRKLISELHVMTAAKAS